MSNPVTIALDAMSGDSGVDVVAPAALKVLSRHAAIRLLLVGDSATIESELARHGGGVEAGRLEIRHASQVVAMDEPPGVALRSKKDSSMRVALDLVKSREADACVCAGNTGALMAIARFVLKTLPGIDRPAICTTIPAINGHTHMLDLGANLDCTAEHLFQFAVMGSILASAVDKIAAPRVGLLNIGAEDIKGSESIKSAGHLLERSDLNYIGFVEGNQIYSGEVDVVVCDGFVGNVSLKTSEGVAKMIAHYLREEFRSSLPKKLVGLLAMPVLNAFKQRIDPRRYNGASLLGLQGIAIKSHGGADTLAFANAVEIALLQVAQRVPGMIDSHLETCLTEATS